MTLIKREIKPAGQYSGVELFRRSDASGMLQDVAMSNMLGVIHQLGLLSRYATEMFREVYELANSTGNDLAELSERTENAATAAIGVKAQLLAANEPAAFYRPADLKRPDKAPLLQFGLFTKNTRDPMLAANYRDCYGPPNVASLDEFAVGGQGSCLKKYSNPSFFFEKWLQNEQERQAAEKKRKEEAKQARRRKKKRRHKGEKKGSKRRVQAAQVQKVVRSGLGAEFDADPGTLSSPANHTRRGSQVAYERVDAKGYGGDGKARIRRRSSGATRPAAASQQRAVPPQHATGPAVSNPPAPSQRMDQNQSQPQKSQPGRMAPPPRSNASPPGVPQRASPSSLASAGAAAQQQRAPPVPPTRGGEKQGTSSPQVPPPRRGGESAPQVPPSRSGGRAPPPNLPPSRGRAAPPAQSPPRQTAPPPTRPQQPVQQLQQRAPPQVPLARRAMANSAARAASESTSSSPQRDYYHEQPPAEAEVRRPSTIDMEPMERAAPEERRLDPKSDPRFAKYVRMQKMGLPQGAIRQAMERDGMDPDELLGGDEPAARAPAAPAARNPPSAQLPTSRPAAASMSNSLLSAIRGGSKLKSAPAQEARQAPAAAPVNPLFAAIRGGTTLRKTERVERPKAADPRANMLAMLRGGGAKLKKVEKVERKASVSGPASGGGGVAAILARRIAIMGNRDDDSESESDDSDWDDDE